MCRIHFLLEFLLYCFFNAVLETNTFRKKQGQSAHRSEEKDNKHIRNERDRQTDGKTDRKKYEQ